MKDLLSELVQARYQAAGGATDEAQKHITEALELIRDALGGCGQPAASVRAVQGYLTDADFFLKKDDSSRAVEALGWALEILQIPSGQSGLSGVVS